MAFKYINPRYGALTGDARVNTFENYTYNPEHGVSFQKVGDSGDYDKIIIPLPQAFTSDIYGKFNLYFNGSSNYCKYFALGAISTYSTTDFFDKCLGVSIANSSVTLRDGSYKTIGNSIRLKNNALNQIQFHIHRGVDQNTSYGELNVNGTETSATFSSNGANYSFSSEKYFFIQFPDAGYHGDKIFISELLISDTEISPKERIIALPISKTITDMTAGESGIYIADAANQTLLQSVDVSTLIENYGANSTVTGIAVVGNPAYKTATGLASLTGISKQGTTVTEHGIYDLSDDTDAVIFDGWATENLTIADLQNMQFGWKAGE